MNLNYDKETGLVTWTLYQEDENIKTYVVPEYFLPFLINGQCSGLTQEDFDQFKDFIEREEIDESLGHWSLPETSEPYFGNNEITKVKGTVIDVEFVDRSSEIVDPPNCTTLSFEDFSKKFNCKSAEVLEILNAKAFDTGKIHFIRMNE